MQLKTRKMIPNISKHPKILNDHAIQSRLIKRFQIRIELLKLCFLQKCVHGQVNPFSKQVAVSDPGCQLVCIEILRISSCAESVPGKINSIRTGVKCSI